jgi:hypothetical protein
MRALIALTFLGLGACTQCPVPAAQVDAGPTTVTQAIVTQTPCQKTIADLQTQDGYLKDLVNGSSSAEHKARNAMTVKNNLLIQLDSLPRVCPSSTATPLAAQVNQRIGQIDAFLRSGVWQGPVG